MSNEGYCKIEPKDGKQFSKDYQPDEKWTEKKSLDLAKELIAWLKAKDENNEDKGNMFYEDFLLIENDYSEHLITYLRGKFSSFSQLIETAKKIQEIKLKKFGVGDRLNATMTKFVLINNHDWKEKTETGIDITTKGNALDFKEIIKGFDTDK